MRHVVMLLALAACAESTPTPKRPAFEGRETEVWLAYEMDVPGRDPDDLLPAFEASARAFGCRAEKLGYGSDQTIGNGELRHWHGVTAYCEEGTLALVTLVGERVRVGCVKPTTRGRCDALLQKIAQAR